MSKKIKKLLKKVGKAALIGGAGYAAMKGLGKIKSARDTSKQNKAFLETEGGDRSDMSTPYENEVSLVPAPRKLTQPKKKNMYSPNDFGLGPYDGAKKGGSAGRVKRSTITGVAVRGFGKALKGKR